VDGQCPPLFFEGWSPAVDVYENNDNVFMKAKLPGMKKEDIEVSVSGDVLNSTGERKEESEYKAADGYRTERYFGRFSGAFPCRYRWKVRKSMPSTRMVS